MVIRTTSRNLIISDPHNLTDMEGYHKLAPASSGPTFEAVGNSASGNSRQHIGHVITNIFATSELVKTLVGQYQAPESTCAFLLEDVLSFKIMLRRTESIIKDSQSKDIDVEELSSIINRCHQCVLHVQTATAGSNGDNLGAADLNQLSLQVQRSLALLNTINSTMMSYSQIAMEHVLREFVADAKTDDQRHNSMRSIMSVDSLEIDQQRAWRLVRKELQKYGITPELFTERKELISKTLQEAIETSIQEDGSTSSLSGIRCNTLPPPSDTSEDVEDDLAIKYQDTAFDPYANFSGDYTEMSGIHASQSGQTPALPTQTDLSARSTKYVPARISLKSMTTRQKALNSLFPDSKHKLKGHSHPVTAIAFSPDGAQLASVSYDEMVRLWNTRTGRVLQTFKGHSDPVTAVAFSPDGAKLASASYDETVRLWNTRTGRALQTLEGHGGSVTAVAFSPDGAQLASASRDKTVRLWDASLD